MQYTTPVYFPIVYNQCNKTRNCFYETKIFKVLIHYGHSNGCNVCL